MYNGYQPESILKCNLNTTLHYHQNELDRVTILSGENISYGHEQNQPNSIMIVSLVGRAIYTISSGINFYLYYAVCNGMSVEESSQNATAARSDKLTEREGAPLPWDL